MPVACPVCHGEVRQVAWRYRGAEIRHCRGCDLQFAWPMTAGSLAYYQSHETYAGLRDQVLAGNVHPGTRAIVAQAVSVARRFLNADQKRVADVGCGSGYLLAELRREGFDCYGFDFNSEMCRIVSEVHGIPARTATLGELAAEGPKYDFIVFSHVLEHLANPLQALQDLKAMLKPHGIVFVCLPNRHFIRQRRALVSGSLPDGNYPPHHVSFWSAPALEHALRTAGFGVLECAAQSYPEPHQAEESLVHGRGVTNRALAAAIARITARLGAVLGVQGANLFAACRAAA